MKKIVFTSILMCLSLILGAQQSGNYGDTKWTLANDTLFISGVGKMPDFIPNVSRKAPPWFTSLYELISSEGKKVASKGLTCKTIVFSDEITNIGDMAFPGCDSLTSVSIPDSVTRIGNMAFTSCHNLTSIIIPQNVTEIGYNAFSDIPNLNSVTIKAATPPELLSSIFNEKPLYPFDGENNTLYVPKGKVPAYKKAGWDKFFKRIVEIK